MSTSQDETPKTYIKSNTATVRGLMSFLSIVLLIVVAGLCAYVLIGYKGIRKNQNSNAQEFNFRLENDIAVILEFYDYEATKCEIPATITGENNKIYPVTVLAETAFTNHGNLTEVKIPNTVTHIMGNAETGKGAFSGCVNLQTVTMGENVTNIGAYAFKNCIALQSIQIPSTVKFVEEGAFTNCLSLDTIDLDSNGELAGNCFENCLNVKTLDLADDVELNLSARKAFAEMVKLTNIIISNTNTKYFFDAEANCLLTKTKEENDTLNEEYDTLILAGCGTSIPASVTKIADWVWGKRAVDNLFIPDTVTDITKNAFANQVIYTNASAIPERWFTPETVTIKTNASIATFNAKNQTVNACVYLDEHGDTVEPAYEDLFPGLTTNTPFKGWDKTGDLIYTAVYESEVKSNNEDIEYDLSGRFTTAGKHLKNLDKRLLFKIDFWENFKTVYYRAEAVLNDFANSYDYEIDYCLTQLDDYIDIMKYPSKEENAQYLESAEWRDKLQNLVDVIDLMDTVDFIETNDVSIINKFMELTEGAKTLLAEKSAANDAVIETIWTGLRDSYESLTADVRDSGPLGRLKAYCSGLVRANYTKESWDKMQICLLAANKITAHNMSISQVRKNLETAVKSLQEVGVEDRTALLKAWIEVCEDLDQKIYQEGEYDELIIKTALVKNKISTLCTRSDIDSEINDLKNLYRNLQFVEGEEKPQEIIVMLAINTLPYFIVAAILFTGAVVASSLSGKLKRKMRKDIDE